MDCVFCDRAGEPLECGHVVCGACLAVADNDTPCPASQLCDGGGVMALIQSKHGGFTPQTDEEAELRERQEILAKRIRRRRNTERAFDALITIRDAHDAIYAAANVPREKDRSLEAERLTALEIVERSIKSAESVVELLELRSSFRAAGHGERLKPLVPQRGINLSSPTLPCGMWTTAYAAAFGRGSRSSPCGVFSVRSGRYVVKSVIIDVRVGQLVSLRLCNNAQCYETVSYIAGVQPQANGPFYEAPLLPESRFPHVRGWVWCAMLNLTAHDTGRTTVFALYHETTGELSDDERYLVLLF